MRSSGELLVSSSWSRCRILAEIGIQLDVYRFNPLPQSSQSASRKATLLWRLHAVYTILLDPQPKLI